MNLELAPHHRAFQDEVRTFLADSFTPDLRRAARRQAGVWAEIDLALAWQRILHMRGWAAPAWPVQYGGPGWDIVERWIFENECAEAGTPAIPAMGLRMCGPVLMRFGTEAQKAQFLPRILSGEDVWCQGYSEPQAGSDLAALTCRAERDGDEYVVTGTKLWTTYAHVSNWIFLLVRTGTGRRPQEGISFLLAPMNAPGIEVRPILTLAGDHEVNQVFFDGARVPIALRVGAEDEGWAIAKYLLEFERGGSFAARLKAQLRDARRAAEAEGAFAGDFARRWAALEAEATAIDLTERRVMATISSGGSPGAASASLLKLAGTEAIQRANELMIESIGPWAAPDFAGVRNGVADWAPGPDYAVPMMGKYLNNRAATIYGGSSEVQRNILARLKLGI